MVRSTLNKNDCQAKQLKMSATAAIRAMEVDDDDYEPVEPPYEQPYMNYENVEEDSYSYPYMDFKSVENSNEHSYLFMSPLSADHESQSQRLETSNSPVKRKTRRCDGPNWKRLIIVWIVLLLGTIVAAAVYISLLHSRINALSVQLKLIDNVPVLNSTNCLIVL